MDVTPVTLTATRQQSVYCVIKVTWWSFRANIVLVEN